VVGVEEMEKKHAQKKWIEERNPASFPVRQKIDKREGRIEARPRLEKRRSAGEKMLSAEGERRCKGARPATEEVRLGLKGETSIC